MTSSSQMIDPSHYDSLGGLLDDALLTFKSETALIEIDRKVETHRLSYLDVRRAAVRVVRWLEAASIEADDRVAILMSNQSRWLIAAYAIFFRGAVLIPIDYKLTADEQAGIIAHSKPKALITEHGLVRRFDELALEHVLVTGAPEEARYTNEATLWESLEADGPIGERVPRTRDDLAAIVYSSGTGGRAKGCMLTHDAYLTQMSSLMARFPMRPGHRYFSILPTNHAIDFMVGFIGPFSCGATVIHQRTLRPEFLKSTMRSYGVTHMALVPLILEAFESGIEEQMREQPNWARRAISVLGGLNEMLTSRGPNHTISRTLLAPIHKAFGGELELLFCGGAFVDRTRAEAFYRLGLPVVIGYGLTEVCTVATVSDLAPFRGDSVGRALDGVEVRVNEPGPDGVGEVWIRGRTVMLGYLDDPELTAKTITPDGWLKTGDLGWMDAAHHLHLVGRQSNMVVTAGGKNIYPEDVEGALSQLPVEELAVFASGFLWPKESDRAGQQLVDEHLVAVIRPRSGNAIVAPSNESVLAQLKSKNRRLPDFKRVRSVLFVDEATPFPRTASMKIKRNELAVSLREREPQERVMRL